MQPTAATALPAPVKQIKYKMKKRKQTIFIICMMALPFLQWLVFWFYVNLSSILLAFEDPRTGGFTLNHFVLFWDSLTSPLGDIKIALRNTLIYFSTSLLIIMPLSLFISYFLYKRIWFYKGFRILFYLPAIITAVAMVASFTNFIDPRGPLGTIVKWFGGTIPPEGLLGNKATATPTIVGYTIWTGFCGNILLFGGAMTRIPLDVLESAKIEGCGPWRELVQLIFPLIWPTVSTLVVFTCTSVFNSSGPILLFTNGSFETTTISFWIFKQVYGTGAVGGSGSYNLVSCAGLCFTLVGVPVILLLRRLLDLVPTVEY